MPHHCFDKLTERHDLAQALLKEREALFARSAELGGLELMAALSDLTDALVLRVFECASDEPVEIAIAAVGGYGRREMAPFSDVDVAFIVRGEENDQLNDVIRRAFRLLMDVLDAAGLKVGYSYRSLDELEHLPLDAQTALLDARSIAGDQTLFTSFQTALRHAISPIAFVIGHVDSRSICDTPFAVEPDIKEGAGGLRDLHAARWIAKIAFPSLNGVSGFEMPKHDVWDGLRANGVLTDAEIAEAHAAHEFLARIRNALHLGAGSAKDVLTSPSHEAVSESLGFENITCFHLSYYMHSGSLSSLLAKVADAACEGELAVEPGVIARNGRLRVLDRGLPARDPAAMLRLFRHIQSYHLKFDRDTLDLVRSQASELKMTPEAAHCFLDVLARPGAGVAVRLMAEAGVLQTVVPQFEELMCLVPGDAAHKFTVGEHSLRAVEELEALFSESNGPCFGISNPETQFADIFSRVQHLDVLFLAVLLHDIGKLDSGKDHAKSGAFRAAKIADRLGMPDDAVRKVEFLVRNHLKMSETARLRDLQQKKTISGFAALIGDPQLLDMLLLLTIADSRSVGSTGWTQVQTRFLLELHERALSAIRSPDAAGPDMERHRNRVRRELGLANLPPEEVDEHCASMPASYLLNTPPDELAAHIGYVRTVRSGSIAVETKDEPGGQFTELTIAAMDQPGLMSKIAGVLHALGIDVHAAQVFTRHSSDDMAIDLLYIDLEGRQLAETKKWQLEAEMLSVLSGATPLDSLLSRMGKKEFRRPSNLTTKVLENLSDHHTVVEIRADDTPGLLHYLTRVISEQGFNIHSARIATWGHEVRDAFYLTTADGIKLSGEDLARLSAAL